MPTMPMMPMPSNDSTMPMPSTDPTATTPPTSTTDVTAPTTTSDALSTYVGSALISLTATDNAGGSGVAHTYYKIDNGAQVEGTSFTVTTAGMHDIEFWSVDVAGNIEVHKTAMLTIN